MPSMGSPIFKDGAVLTSLIHNDGRYMPPLKIAPAPLTAFRSLCIVDFNQNEVQLVTAIGAVGGGRPPSHHQTSHMVSVASSYATAAQAVSEEQIGIPQIITHSLHNQNPTKPVPF